MDYSTSMYSLCVGDIVDPCVGSDIWNRQGVCVYRIGCSYDICIELSGPGEVKMCGIGMLLYIVHRFQIAMWCKWYKYYSDCK